MKSGISCLIGKALISAALVVIVFGNPLAAQERITDTLRLIGPAIPPGDTGSVFIYVANSEALGGYSVRFAYDTSLVEVVTSPQNPTSIPAVQLRGKGLLAFARPNPGVVSGVVVFGLLNTFPAGSGNTLQLDFYAKPYAVADTAAILALIDHPDSPYSSNWFALPDGLTQYRPTRLDGSIWVGCDCAGLGDGNGDGQITAQEVLVMAGQVYRSFAGRMRELPRCPLPNGDWNCDGSLNPIDIVLLVQYVYSGPAAGPCDPCSQ